MPHLEQLEPRTLLAVLPATTSVNLNGTWQLQRSDAADLASLGTTWSDITVPSLMTWNAQPYAWYRRPLQVASDWTGGHVFLEFDAVRYVSDVYLNGTRIGGHFGGWEPFEVDITGLYTPGGTDQLTLRVHDLRGVLTDPNVPYTTGDTPADGSGNNVLAPVGSMEQLFGIWQDVRLEYRPDVYIADIAITTSVRQNSLSAAYTLRNLGPAAKQVTLDPQVIDGPLTALDLAPQTVTVPSGGSLKVTFTQPWANPSLWMPDSPKLYFLNATLSETGGSALLPHSERFGFREFWINGTQFILNGTPMNFLGTAGHPRWDGTMQTDDEIRAAFAAARTANVNSMRLHANIWPANWYKVADEIGLPIILESAIWCYARAYALDNPIFWQNARDHWSGVISAHRNHPSVVMYSIENEIMHVGGGRVSTTVKSLGDLGRYVKSLDPTRPIMFDGDDDPDGAADVINLHYPHEFPRYVDYPNTADWLNQPTVVDSYPSTSWQWSRNKPLYMGEYLWMFQQSNSNSTAVLGDSAYAEDSSWRAKAEAWRYQTLAYRRAGVSGLCPWTLWESGSFPNYAWYAVKEVYEPNGAYPREYDTRFFSTQEVQRTIDLYNDTLYPANLTLEWRINGQSQGTSTFALTPAQRVNTTITLTMPAVTAQQDVTFDLVVRNGANVVYSNTRTYSVYPTSTGQLNLPAGKRIAVFQGDGTASAYLQSNNIAPLILTDLANVRSLNPDLLVIDAHALDTYPGAGTITVAGGATAELRNFMRAGGTILVLNQNTIPVGLLPASLAATPTTIGFARETTHPIMQGLDDLAVRFWRGDHYIAQYTLRKPATGGFRILADAGQSSGLERILAMEMPQGPGRLILSQFLISGKLATEPVAQLLLKRMVEYGITAPAATAPVGVVDPDGSIQTDLTALGVSWQDLTGTLATANLASFKVLLVDAKAPEVTTQKTRLKAYAQSGGSVILHGPDAATMASLGATVPGELTVVPSMTVPVQVSNRTDPVSAGMMSEDLYWTTGPAPRWDERVTLDTGVLLGAVTKQPPALADTTVVECETMSPPPAGRGNVTGGIVQLWTNASIEKTITLPSTGAYFLGVYGRGTPVNGIYPNIAIYLDNQLVGYTTVGATTALYGFTAQATAGAHLLRLTFTNDDWNPDLGEDRNVWLDKFAFKAVPAGPEVTLLQPGGLVRVDDGAGRWVIDEVNWDGRIATSTYPARYLTSLLDNLGAQYPIDDSVYIPMTSLQPTTTSTLWSITPDGSLRIGTNLTFLANVDFRRSGTYQITLSVKGNLAGGAYSIARAMFDNAGIGDYQTTSDNWENATFTRSVTAGMHTVGVRFTNDYWDATTNDDRNLYVRSLRIQPLSLPNAAPTDIGLTAATIAENRPAGTPVGTLWTVDPDPLDTFTYTLVSGTGSSGNAFFTLSGNQLLTAAGFDFEATPSYSIRLRSTDPGGLWVEKTFTITVTDVDEIAPTIASSSINDGAAQRSMVRTLTVLFSEPVTIGAGAITVTLSTGAAIPGTAVALTNPSTDGKTYLLTFSGPAIIGSSLPDGVYDLKVLASGIHDLAGNALTANYTRRFHRLFGDANGDRTVNLADYRPLRLTLSRSAGHPLFNDALDFDSSAAVTLLDLTQFRRRFGARLRY